MKKIIMTGMILLISGCAPYMHNRDDRRHDRDYPRKDGSAVPDGRDGSRDENERREQDDNRYKPGYQ